MVAIIVLRIVKMTSVTFFEIRSIMLFEMAAIIIPPNASNYILRVSSNYQCQKSCQLYFSEMPANSFSERIAITVVSNAISNCPKCGQL